MTETGIDPVYLSRSILFGVAVGDALGVPVEFKSRELIRKQPVTGMTGYGTYNLPPGTFSDDSSLTLCLAEALAGDFSIQCMAENFLRWYHHGYWTANGDVFDIGNATREALDRIYEGIEPLDAGGNNEHSNGNGSLMRIAPLLLHTMEKPLEERLRITREVSSVTHRHMRSVIACHYYLEMALALAQGMSPKTAYQKLQSEIPFHFNLMEAGQHETARFRRLLEADISLLNEPDISGSGYVIHTLEASVWCLLTTDSYTDAVLKAVNLGEDTDTTAAVAGGLAGIYYGYNAIPESWLQSLARRNDIDELAARLGNRFAK